MRIAENNLDMLKSLLADIEPEQAVYALQCMFISYVQRTEYCQLPKSERANIVFCYVVMHEFFMNIKPLPKTPVAI